MKPIEDPSEVTRSQLAKVLECELTTIDRWRDGGCPHWKKGNNVMFSIAEVVDWRIKRQVHRVMGDDPDKPKSYDLMHEQARLAAAKADDQERKNRLADGEIIGVEQAAELFAPFGREIRQRLMAMGSVVGPKVGRNVQEQRRIKAAIDNETHKALKALNEYEGD